MTHAIIDKKICRSWHEAIGRRHALIALLLCWTLLLCPGCVTSKKYRLARDDTPPAKPLGWTASTPTAELTLATLIVFKGPGSWKREARWDEYVVRIVNHSTGPLVIRSAELTDVLGQPQFPGSEPWSLEKLSYTNWEKYGKTGLKVLAGAGVVALYGTAVMASSFGSFMAGPGAAAGGSAALEIIPIVALVDIGVVAVMNHNNRVKVEAEFQRRRLKLPLTVEAGGRIEGSLFFPMTPGPQRLVLQCTGPDGPLDLDLPLKPLAGLHLEQHKDR